MNTDLRLNTQIPTVTSYQRCTYSITQTLLMNNPICGQKAHQPNCCQQLQSLRHAIKENTSFKIRFQLKSALQLFFIWGFEKAADKIVLQSDVCTPTLLREHYPLTLTVSHVHMLSLYVKIETTKPDMILETTWEPKGSQKDGTFEAHLGHLVNSESVWAI